jgi:membrane protease YdiL (CAAX protease family)
LIIIFLWPVLHGLALVITDLFNQTRPDSPFLQEVIKQPNTIPLVIFLYLLQAGVEEIGWRGYLQEKLYHQFGPTLSSLLVGIFHTIWHLPLFWLVGTNQFKMGFGLDFIFFVGLVISTAVVTAWCYLDNRHSILAAALLHTTGNLSFDIFGYAPGSFKHRIFIGLVILAAGLVLFILMQRKHPQHI